MANDTILLDTSVLLQATFSDLPCHAAVWATLERARRGDGDLAVSVHSLAELAWLVGDAAVVASPDSPALVRRKLDEFLGAGFLRKLPLDAAVLRRQAELIERCGLSGPRTLDALVAATMLEHGIPVLHTLHPADFAVFEGIRAVNPYA